MSATTQPIESYSSRVPAGESVENTESPESRELRYKGQLNAEKAIRSGHFDGRSLQYRLFGGKEKPGIREMIFEHFDHVKSVDINSIRPYDTKKTVGLLFPREFKFPSWMILKSYLYGTNTLVSDVYRELKSYSDEFGGKLPDEKAALRLASVVYSLGVTIHPFPDGNGQTYRTTALSYLAELDPVRYENSSFPARLEKTYSGGGQIEAKGETKIAKGKTPNLDTLEDIKAILEIQMTPRITHKTRPEPQDFPEGENDPEYMKQTEDFDKAQERADKWISGLLEENPDILRVVGLNQGQKYNYEEYAAARSEKMSAKIEALSKRGVSKTMIWGRHDGQNSPTIVDYYLDYLLFTQRGNNWIRNYVLGQPQETNKDVPNDLRWVEKTALEAFEKVGQQIVSLLKPAKY